MLPYGVPKGPSYILAYCVPKELKVQMMRQLCDFEDFSRRRQTEHGLQWEGKTLRGESSNSKHGNYLLFRFRNHHHTKQPCTPLPSTDHSRSRLRLRLPINTNELVHLQRLPDGVTSAILGTTAPGTAQ